jgi:hypothetical protein
MNIQYTYTHFNAKTERMCKVARVKENGTGFTRTNVFCFLSSLPLPPRHHSGVWLQPPRQCLAPATTAVFGSSHHGSVCLLPVISLFLTNIVSTVRACLSLRLERFLGSQKEDERGPLRIQSSLAKTLIDFCYKKTLPDKNGEGRGS